MTGAAPEARALLGRALTEALAMPADGWVDDGLAFVAPWGFELNAVSMPVVVWAGAVDRLVSVGHARYIASQIPNAELHVIPHRGMRSTAGRYSAQGRVPGLAG
ncbi:MAG: hypothetical protein QOJ13_3309 [Gaiellales bacterium]|jgi:pimeloyl-ACP methyl ester carboxylesterase|nr:hypothetical protein [Gaiellales bacterium]